MSLTLRFTEWTCGHHGTRPADIPVSSGEQAIQIAWAIAHAISQPGSARAVLMTEERAETLYLTDDYVAVGHSSSDKLRSTCQWAERPVVIVGSEADVEAIHAADLAEARDAVLVGEVLRLDLKRTLYGDEIATSTLPRAELEALALPEDAYGQRRHQVFELPPVFRDAAEVLAALRQDAADEAAYQAELAAERATTGSAA